MDKHYREVVSELKRTQKELIETKRLYAAAINANHELTLKTINLQDALDTLKAGQY